MKKLISVLTLVLALGFVTYGQTSRSIVNFDKGWRFTLSDPDGAFAAQFNDRSWRLLDLPHDWSIEGENLESNPGGPRVGYFPMGTGWYRKTFDVAGYSKGRIYSIEFDGIYMNSTVWLNGHELGTWPYGYSSFSYDLTPYLKAKGNVIAVRVDNSMQPNSRWYSGSGIYRHVRLVSTAKTRFDRWGVFGYTGKVDGGNAVIKISSAVRNDETKSQKATVRQTVLDASGAVVATGEQQIDLPASGKMDVEQHLQVSGARLWKLDDPYLYTLRSEIIVAGKQKDLVENSIGIRTIEYDIDKGFFLNGEHIKMKGVNVHHDGGAVGAAVPERVWERRLEILKEGGCNAIRTAHNAPAPEFLDLCDKMGLLVMDEAFDIWNIQKTDFDYHLQFDEWHLRDLEAMVARDRNHPSIVMWSIGNEIIDQTVPEGAGRAKEMIDFCHRLDPTRLVTTGNDQIVSLTPTLPEFLAAFENDIVGYNYPDRWRERRELYYSIDKAEFPERRVVGTETGGVGGARGRYNPRNIISNNLIDVEHRWRFTTAYDYVIGDFMWTGIDYYGESRWPSRGSNAGILDNCGFKKDGWWFYKSIWCDEPVVHLLPHWNWEGHEGEIIQVACFSNCETVELFVNGKSYGRKSTEYPRRGVSVAWNRYATGKHYATTGDLHVVWDVEYQGGEIKAVGVRDGKTYEDVIRTAGAPAQLRATVDRPSFKAEPGDVAHVTVEVLDAEGNLCPVAENGIRFDVNGGNLIGVESGNMADLSSVKASERKAFAGMCLGIVGSDRKGTVSVTVTSPGLKSSTVTFQAE